MNTGWRSRNYIPHFDQPELTQFITFRLEDAVPESVIKKWKIELEWKTGIPAGDPRQITLRKRIEKYEDAGYGACWLRNEQVASMVEETLLHHDGRRYRIIAWCIMPNHVHTIIELMKQLSLAEIMHSWKPYSSHEANKILNRSGQFWFREYYDRYIRDPEHLVRAVEYVENNPVKAGLVSRKEHWRWSSAWERRRPAGSLLQMAGNAE
jgi:putative transposase